MVVWGLLGATTPPPPTTTATPTLTPVSGTYTGSQSVNISDATTSATIYYTTNGTTPTTSSTVYAGPITVSGSETIEAIAVASGLTNSAVGSATYTIQQGTTGHAGFLTSGWDLHGNAVGKDIGYDQRRNDLLHDQRHDADDGFDGVRRADQCQRE
jgi:hypothetical protein